MWTFCRAILIHPVMTEKKVLIGDGSGKEDMKNIARQV